MVRGSIVCALLVANYGIVCGSYVKGDGNSNDCPAGTQKITDAGECNVGAHAVGGSYQDVGEWTDYPGGCYGNGITGKVWFNTHTGAARSHYGEVCRTTPPILPSYLAKGPYAVKATRYTGVHGMDVSDQAIDVWYPVGAEGQKFPLIAYAHGFGDGDESVANHYVNHLNELAAFGYIIAASEACNIGCSDLASLSGDPPGFKNYYNQQLKVIDWAKESAASGDPIMLAMDLDVGVGVAGHSMGGQSTLFSAGADAAVAHGIKAAVLQHAYTHVYPAPSVPFLAFTGTLDTTALPSMTSEFYNAEGANSVKGLVNKVGMGHREPRESSDFNPALASLTAAWFKLYLDETPQADNIDYHDLIFNKMCAGEYGYDGPMEQCEVHGGTGSQIV